MLNQGYVPCDKQIHIKLSEAELQMIQDRMAQMKLIWILYPIRMSIFKNGIYMNLIRRI